MATCSKPTRRATWSGRRSTSPAPPSPLGFNRCVGAGYVGILSVELHFPEAGSLEGKRKHVKSAKAQLQNRFGASVAEGDHHQLWQRARLTPSSVTRDNPDAEQLLVNA